ncbi:MAG: B12-binding domain-containing radical SAM protein [Desulfobacteraceae bacterium]|nr:B12-binding domain-containing radical SAM protein [Desulfobacteraceae bacterium]
MAKTKILLVSPVSQKRILGEDFLFKLPVLALPTLAAYTPPDCDVHMVDERIQVLDFNADADLVGITSMTALAPRAYAIADRFRCLGKTVVMGGMHPSAMPAEALEHCDSVVAGEGELVWPRVVEDFKQGRLKRIYKADHLFDVSQAKPPRWDIIDKERYTPVDFIETTRGCPFNCSYCAVTNFFGGKHRTKPLEMIEKMVSKVKTTKKRFALKNLVFFVDDNIVGNRSYCMELFKLLKTFNLQWVGQASITVTQDEQLLKRMSETRCLGLLIGLESLSDKTLSQVGKRVNRPSEYIKAVEKLHKYGIGIKSSFMVGFDNDDITVFDTMARFILNSNLDSVYISIMTPYPGTKLFEKMESQGRILHRNWEKYDSGHVVFQPARMTVRQLQEGYLRLYRKALSYRSIALRLWRARTQLQFFLPDNLAFRQCLLKVVNSFK